MQFFIDKILLLLDDWQFCFAPAYEALVEFHHAIAFVCQNPGCLFAASSAAAIHSHGALHVEGGGFFCEIGLQDVDVRGTGNMSFGIFIGSAGVNHLHRGVGNHFLEFLRSDSGEIGGAATSHGAKQATE